MEPIRGSKISIQTTPQKTSADKSEEVSYSENSEKIIEELNKMSNVNKAMLSYQNQQGYELNLSSAELAKRISKDYMTVKKLLAPDAEEYTSLSEGDKKALQHLVKAAYILEEIQCLFGIAHVARSLCIFGHGNGSKAL